MKWIDRLNSNRGKYYLLGLVTLIKILDSVVSVIAQHTIPYLGFFSYGQTMLQYGMPDFIRALTNFDGIFYIRIAKKGYEMTEQAYFPLYPLLIRYLDYIVGNPILSGLIISLTSFVLGLLIFKKYLISVTSAANIPWVLLFVLLHPISYYYGVLYTEGLFFLLFVATLYFYHKRIFGLAMLFALLTSLTKVVGTSLIGVIGVMLIAQIINSRVGTAQRLISVLKKNWQSLLVMLSSLTGLGLYMYYLAVTMGDPLYFVRAQESFGANRSSHLITPFQVIYRYIRIFATADFNFQYFVAVVEIIFFVAALSLIAIELVKLWRRYKSSGLIHVERLGLAAFSLANIIIPSSTGTLTAMPRYSLMSLTVYLTLAEISSTRLKISLLVLFSLIHIIFFALFTQGYYLT